MGWRKGKGLLLRSGGRGGSMGASPAAPAAPVMGRIAEGGVHGGGAIVALYI